MPRTASINAWDLNDGNLRHCGSRRRPDLVNPRPRVLSIPQNRSWLSSVEVARLINVSRWSVWRRMRDGRIRTVPHPLTPNRRVIPISELIRLRGVASERIPMYGGPHCPHERYIFFLLAHHNDDRESLTRDLQRRQLSVPPEDVLSEMQAALLKTSGRRIREHRKRYGHYKGLWQYPAWLRDLGFEEIHDNPEQFVPLEFFNHTQARFVVDLMIGSCRNDYEILCAAEEMAEFTLSLQQIRNYRRFCFDPTILSAGDYQRHHDAIAQRSPQEAKIREECHADWGRTKAVLGIKEEVDVLTGLHRQWVERQANVDELKSYTTHDAIRATCREHRAVGALTEQIVEEVQRRRNNISDSNDL